MPKTHSGFFKMLSTRTRVQILKLLLRNDDLTVDDLASRLDVSVPTVSRHLQLLRMQDLVSFRQDAQTRYYHVNKEEIIRGVTDFLEDLGIHFPEVAPADPSSVPPQPATPAPSPTPSSGADPSTPAV